MIMLKPGDQVSVVILLNRTYNLTDDAATVAKLAGVSLETLSGIVEDGKEWEPEESTLDTMSKHETADIESEDWDVEEIIEA
jgi:hypothetical protein